MYKNPYHGKFIVFEGPDGSGKSLQAELLVKYLKENGREAVLTYEPTHDGTQSKKLQDVLEHKAEMDPEALQELFTEDRREHLDHAIHPALHEGKIVVSDRYFFSTFAYGMLSVPLEKLIAMNETFLIPDLAFVIDVEVKTSMEHILARHGGESTWRADFFVHDEKLRETIENYRTLGSHFPDLVFIDGNRSPAEVHTDIVAKVKSILS
jgi:dTMP kinase